MDTEEPSDVAASHRGSSFRIEEMWEKKNTTEEVSAEAKALRQMYDSGKPMYPRDAMIDAARQIKAKSEMISIRGWDDVTNEYKYHMNDSKDCEQYFPVVHFQSLENMMTLLVRDDYSSQIPLEISWRSSKDQDLSPKHTLEELIVEFNEYQERWLQGDFCRKLKDSLFHGLPSPPKKVIGFGLGSLDHAGRSNQFCQHAVLTLIEEVLGESGTKVGLYCQDPAYTSVDKELLKHLNIEVLDSPMGFLEVDGTSIVVSVAPNVPVKQIVADDEKYWPMAMIWCSVSSVDDEIDSYIRKRILWCDPTGNRVRSMIQHYVCTPLPGEERFSGCDIELYTRKDSS